MALLRGPHAQGVYTTATLELRQETRTHNGKTTKYGVTTLRPHITGSIREATALVRRERDRGIDANRIVLA